MTIKRQFYPDSGKAKQPPWIFGEEESGIKDCQECVTIVSIEEKFVENFLIYGYK